MDRLFWVIIFGLLLPWVGIFWLWLKAPRETIVIYPFAAMVGMAFSCLGAQFGLFVFLPHYTSPTYPTLFVDFGLYPMVAVAAIFAIHHQHRRPLLILLAMAAILTLAEAIVWFMHWVDYGHGWNFVFTYISYLLAVWLVYGYYRWLLAQGILERHWEFSRRIFR